MRLPEEPDIPPQINIVPMIDVIFAILAFFIVSALFLSRNEGLPVNLPEASTGVKTEEIASVRITVTVAVNGDLEVNKKPVTLESIKKEVQELIAPNQLALVFVNADERVSHGRVVTVMDRLRQISGVKLAIATQADNQNP